MNSSHAFLGKSGSAYQFQFFGMREALPQRPGIYMFVKQGMIFENESIYVGQSQNFVSRPGIGMSAHERAAEAKRLGATVIALHPLGSQAQRDLAERDLIAGLNPPLNVHHRNNAFHGGIL